MKRTLIIILSTAVLLSLLVIPVTIAGASGDAPAVAVWHLNESSGTTAADSSGNNNHGTLNNMDTATCWVSGKYGNALNFDGVDDYVNFGSDDSLELIDELTITLWVNRADKTTFERFLSHSIDSSTYAYEVGVDYTEPNMWRLRLNSDSATLKVAMAGEPGQWIHVTYVYDSNLPSGNMKIYENGIPVATGDYNQPLTNHGQLLTNRQGKADGWLKSTIDEVYIWPRALNAQEIAALMNQFVPMSRFEIENAQINFNEPGDDRAQVAGNLELDLINGDGVDISEDVTVTVGPFTEIITMQERGSKKNKRWTYQRPHHIPGGIKDMTINWKKGTFDFSIDNADLSDMTDPNSVIISLCIGNDIGNTAIDMKEKRQWSYRDNHNWGSQSLGGF
ncbi:MAG: LamG domain-containing protein [Dehalococcoidales bacterium]|nr:LamG domain-containing protein [Dehalococcoidales bacterium]